MIATSATPYLTQGTLTDYLSAYAWVSDTALEQNNEALLCCQVVDEVFLEAVDTVGAGAPASSQLLNMHSRILFCSAVRAALAGDFSPLAPILRASLESACYAQEIQRDPTLQDVWMKRHEGDEHRKRSRKVFGSGVIDHACSRLATIIEGEPRIITEHYDRLVDYGAHPNVAAVLHGMSMRETEDHWIIERGGPSSINIESCLFFVFQTGLYTAMVVANGTQISHAQRKKFINLMQVLTNWEGELRHAALRPSGAE